MSKSKHSSGARRVVVHAAGAKRSAKPAAVRQAGSSGGGRTATPASAGATGDHVVHAGPGQAVGKWPSLAEMEAVGLVG